MKVIYTIFNIPNFAAYVDNALPFVAITHVAGRCAALANGGEQVVGGIGFLPLVLVLPFVFGVTPVSTIVTAVATAAVSVAAAATAAATAVTAATAVGVSWGLV